MKIEKYMKFVASTLLAVMFSIASPVYGAQQGLKIGYVNFVKVIEQAPQAKTSLKKLEAEFSPRDKNIVDLQNKIKLSESKLEKEVLVLKTGERRTIERDLLRMKRDLRRLSQEFREDYNLRRNEELSSLQKLVTRVIEDIARKDKYDLIVHEGTLYASKRVDITRIVLERLGSKIKR
jgi:outer membrane protein